MAVSGFEPAPARMAARRVTATPRVTFFKMQSKKFPPLFPYTGFSIVYSITLPWEFETVDAREKTTCCFVSVQKLSLELTELYFQPTGLYVFY